MNQILAYILVCVIAYLLGSISTGLLVAKFTGGPNLREVGSGNTGANNALRAMGLRGGLLTFLGDCGKAALACGIGWWLAGGLYGAMLAGVMAVLGHNWPVFFQFKGGKGVASSVGVMLVCFPVPALISIAVTIGIIAATRFVSLGSMCLLVIFSVIVSAFYSGGNLLIILWSVLLAVMCILRHHENIGRLIHGKESKLGQRV